MAKKSKKSKKAPSIKSYEHLLYTNKNKKYVVVGMWAMIVSVLAAAILGLVDTPAIAWVLIVVGFIVGFVNYDHEETAKYLTANMTLLVVATAIIVTGVSRLSITAPLMALYLERAAYNVIAVVAPAAFVVALKAFKELAQ